MIHHQYLLQRPYKAVFTLTRVPFLRDTLVYCTVHGPPLWRAYIKRLVVTTAGYAREVHSAAQTARVPKP